MADIKQVKLPDIEQPYDIVDASAVHHNKEKIGDINKPIYVKADGEATAIDYTIDKSVPADAKFTDTTYEIATTTTDGLMSHVDKERLDNIVNLNAMKFVGISTTDPSGSSGATVAGHTQWVKGEVVLYKKLERTYYAEYINLDGQNTSASWELLGDAESYKLKQSAVEDPSASGTSLSFISNISQNTEGVIEVTKKNIGVNEGDYIVLNCGSSTVNV